MEVDRKHNSNVFLINQELELARILAGNDEKARNKALKNLNHWLVKRSNAMPFMEKDLQKLWKGLFYCMWMSDKPLVQEECAEKISKLVHFPDTHTALLFFKAGLFMLSQEWNGIDQLRLDKFLMLIRKLLRETLRVLQQHSFTDKNIESFNEVILNTILNDSNKTPVGLFMHFNEIFLEELAKVTRGKIHGNSIVTFLRPFIQHLIKSDDGREIGHIKKFIFNYLMRQSDVGLDYKEKYEAWKQQGFPGSINSMQKIKIKKVHEHSNETDKDVSSGSPKEKPLDPRAGRVDVEIPQLRFDPRDVSNALLASKFDKKSSTRSRNIISLLVEQFNKLSKGIYPLGINKIDVKDKNEDINIKKSANRLIKFEQKLMGKERKRKRDKENNEQVEMKRRKIEDSGNKESTTDEKKKSSTKLEKEKQKNVVNGESSNKLEKLKKRKDKHSKDHKKSRIEENTLTLVNDNRRESNLTKNKEKKVATVNIINDAHIVKDKKNKSNLTLVDNRNNSNIVKAKERLKIKKHKLLKKKKNADDDIECIFERNSGTWVVYEVHNSSSADKRQKSAKLQNLSFHKSPNKSGQKDFKESKVVNKEKISLNMSSESTFLESPIPKDESTKAGLSPVKLFESPPEKELLFPKTAWDELLEEGEYEICIPAKKYLGKMKKQAENKNKSIHELINTTLQKIKGKSRLSLDSRLIRDPYSRSGSGKKVKINTKLNKSQEIYEHIANVKSSPGIPYDAARKPSKPLLKPTANSTPVNPFYKKQLSFL